MDINEILAEVGITVPEEKVQQFNKLVRTNYKSAAEVNKLRGEIDNLKESVSKLTVDNENLTKSNKGVEDIETKHKTEIESLTAKIAEYEGKLKDIELTKTIKCYFKDSKFISKRVEDSVIEEIKKKNFEFKDGNTIIRISGDYYYDLHIFGEYYQLCADWNSDTNNIGTSEQCF